jgi:predicted O-methyltransferase YrrM
MLPKKINQFIDRLRLRRIEKHRVSNPYDWNGYRLVLEDFVPRSLPHKIYLNQIWEEWKRLLDLFVPEQTPKRILEIGTGRAGSTYFLTKVGGEGSLVVTVDSEPLAKEYVGLYPRYPRQRIHSVTGKSHDSETVNMVKNILRDEPLDILYIDGDHSYDGVKMDFEIYKRFCNEKTIICFHDIIPDHGTSRGIQTEAYTGGVYKFWAELKENRKYTEFVNSPDQDGFGIGVLLPGHNPGQA